LDSFPVSAADNVLDQLPPGRWRGNFLFNLDHTWDASQTNLVNYYSLRSEIVVGTLIFQVARNGQISYSRIIIHEFPYTVVSSLIDSRFADNPCKGYNAFGGGMGTVRLSTQTVPAPSLGPTVLINVPSVAFSAGTTWEQVSVVGDCGGEPPSKTLDSALQADFGLLSASNWTFTATAVHKTWMAGSCLATSWTTENRSVNCWWSAWPSR
jgi:hypothetical protein